MKSLIIVFGTIVLGWGCAATLAPRITDTSVHRKVGDREECLSCHLRGMHGAPVAPARMLKEDRRVCTRCHR